MQEHHVYSYQELTEQYNNILDNHVLREGEDANLYNLHLHYFNNDLDQLEILLNKTPTQFDQRWKSDERRADKIIQRCRLNIVRLLSMSEFQTEEKISRSDRSVSKPNMSTKELELKELSDTLALQLKQKPDNASNLSRTTNIFKSLYQMVTQTKGSRIIPENSTPREDCG